MILCQDILIMHGTYIINDGKVENINLTKGGTCKINKGEIGTIELSNESADIELTIGDINSQVNNNNPKIQKIQANTDLVSIDTVINFYNGIIKMCFFNLENEPGFVPASQDNMYEYTYNRRAGYKAQNTADGTILVKE